MKARVVQWKETLLTIARLELFYPIPELGRELIARLCGCQRRPYHCTTHVLVTRGSEFFGADPVLMPNAELFKEIGMFFPFAVSGQTAIADAYILEDGEFTSTFFTKLINRTNIDLLLMDNEDGEYEIVPQLAIENILEKAGMPNTNVEIIGHLTQHSLQDHHPLAVV
ncbi:unnamed protein product [Nippostrongylus brasiliensis]|uniref:Lactamase_B domain-containing protein n=1 Tax=Nippostrongylus brasiliensis TaxID=27835 RepID=A0A0N4XEI2_NIPBR|nr:unnamed protein product [Nippostrongylus brasiliensis]